MVNFYKPIMVYHRPILNNYKEYARLDHKQQKN